MKSASSRPLTLCIQSSRAGHRLLRAAGARRTPAVTADPVFITVLARSRAWRIFSTFAGRLFDAGQRCAAPSSVLTAGVGRRGGSTAKRRGDLAITLFCDKSEAQVGATVCRRRKVATMEIRS